MFQAKKIDPNHDAVIRMRTMRHREVTTGKENAKGTGMAELVALTIPR